MNKITYAFFDIDGTLIKMNSMLDFFNYSLTNLNTRDAKLMLSNYNANLKMAKATASRELLNKLYYRSFAGLKRSTLESLSFDWFSKLLINNSGVFNQEVLQKLLCHQKNNHLVVFVSGGFFATVTPIAQYLDVRHILCVDPIVKGRLLTGEIELGSQTIGYGKVNAIKRFVDNNGGTKGDLLNSYAYGDHISDYGMLSIVGNPYIVGDDLELCKIAKSNGWTIL